MTSGRHHDGDGAKLFAMAFLALTLLCLSQIGAQTKFSSSGALVAQPRFWPAVGLGGMMLFGAVHLAGLWHRRGVALSAVCGDAVRVGEFALWFMIYVWVTPLVGYLPSTMAFMLCLGARLGYRDGRMLGTAALTGGLIVLLFKTLLAVKIPGGALYEMLPAGLRAVMIAYF